MSQIAVAKLFAQRQHCDKGVFSLHAHPYI
jgi:hypothetical protein